MTDSFLTVASTVPPHQTLLVTSSLSWYSMALSLREVICAGTARNLQRPDVATIVERRITLDPGRAI